jgi:hypothetical protein
MMEILKRLLVLLYKRRMKQSNSSSSLTIQRSQDMKEEVKTGKEAAGEVAETTKEEVNMIRDIRVRVIRDKTGPQGEATQRTTTKEITKTTAKKITVNKSMLTKVTKEVNISLNSKIKYRMNLGKKATGPRPQVDQDRAEKENTNHPKSPMKSEREEKVVNTNRRNMEPYWVLKQEQWPRKETKLLLNRIRERSSRRTDLRSLRISEQFQFVHKIRSQSPHECK